MAEKPQPSIAKPTDVPESSPSSNGSPVKDTDTEARSRVAMLRSKAQWRIEPSTGGAPAPDALGKAQPAPSERPRNDRNDALETGLSGIGRPGPAKSSPGPARSAEGEQAPAIQVLKQQIASAAGITSDSIADPCRRMNR